MGSLSPSGGIRTFQIRNARKHQQKKRRRDFRRSVGFVDAFDPSFLSWCQFVSLEMISDGQNLEQGSSGGRFSSHQDEFESLTEARERHHQQVRMSRAAADSGFCSRFLPHTQAAARTPLRFPISSNFMFHVDEHEALTSPNLWAHFPLLLFAN